MACTFGLLFGFFFVFTIICFVIAKRLLGKRRITQLDVSRALLGLGPNEPLWVFGYGSIVWKWGMSKVKPLERRSCCIRGYQRRSYQLSTDHRGTPQFPGRVVTLEPSGEECIVHGAVYKIAPEDIPVALENLEVREKQYDARIRIHVYSDEGATASFARAVTWIATDSDENINWGGPAPLDHIAETISKARGPSGENKDYLFNLANAFRAVGVVCEHTFELEKRVKTLLARVPH